MYYQDKINSLKSIFGKPELVLGEDFLQVDNTRYPIINDVIILSEPNKYTDFVRKELKLKENEPKNNPAFAEDIQYTFSQEWKEYNEILPEHKEEFLQYFDIVSLDALQNLRVLDLGCGNGRWSYYLKDVAEK